MLSSILNSDNAIEVNIAIMRAFVQMRKFFETNKELAEKIEELERTVSSHDEDILLIFEAIKQLMHKKVNQWNRSGLKFPRLNEADLKVPIWHLKGLGVCDTNV